jgi:hypothetical protein
VEACFALKPFRVSDIQPVNTFKVDLGLCMYVPFGDRVLRRIFGPKKVEVTGEWRRLHNEELYSGDQVKKNEVGMACGRCR